MRAFPAISRSLIATVMAGLTITASSEAAIIVIDPLNVSSSTEIPGFDRKDDYIVDGSGLSGGRHNNGANGEAWLSTGTGYGGDDLEPWVIFDLGDTYTINSFQVWNYNENATGVQVLRGVNAVTVEYGTTLIGGDTVGGVSGTVAGITNFAIADGTSTYTGEVFNTFTAFNARYIKLDINSNHGGDNNFYGLSEVQFDGVLVPEASSIALLSLGGIGLLLRRRR